MYRERMLNYYPLVIQSILEFQAIIDAEYPEFERLDENNERVISDAYLTTMSEQRISQWENALNIKPLEGSSVEDRRETILARIRGQGKLNTASINAIVGTFTGGTAKSWIENSVLNVAISVPRDNKQYRFENVEQELVKKVPAHLGIKVFRNYAKWDEVIGTDTTWGDIKSLGTWEDVMLSVSN